MLNSINIQGNLTKDPELKHTTNGRPVLSFSIACDRDKKESESYFFTVVAWEGTAEFIAKYFVKGQQILVDGHLQSRNYEDRDGKKRTATEIVADRVYFSGRKETRPSEEPAPFDAYESDEDFPF